MFSASCHRHQLSLLGPVTQGPSIHPDPTEYSSVCPQGPSCLLPYQLTADIKMDRGISPSSLLPHQWFGFWIWVRNPSGPEWHAVRQYPHSVQTKAKDISLARRVSKLEERQAARSRDRVIERIESGGTGRSPVLSS